MSRFSFRKDIKFDIALLSEVESSNPFGFRKAKPIWEQIAATLKDGELKMPVTDRNCRERVTNLLKEFRNKETLSVKASGVDEDEMSKITQLLTSIAKLEDEKPNLTTEKLYSKKGRQDADQTRNEALEFMKSVGLDDDVIEMVQEGDEKTDGDPPKPAEAPDVEDLGDAPPRKKAKKADTMVSYLAEKSKGELLIRSEELKVRAAEADNKRFELQIMKERQDADLEERRQMNSLTMKMFEKLTGPSSSRNE